VCLACGGGPWRTAVAGHVPRSALEQAGQVRALFRVVLGAWGLEEWGGGGGVGVSSPPTRDWLVEECACSASCCRQPEGAGGGQPPRLATLSHVFVSCPVVRPVVLWLRRLWRDIAGAEPPLDARVLVVVDRSVWKPPGGEVLWEMWTHLCLLFCRVVWLLTERRSDGGPEFAASALVAAVALAVERAIRSDWAQVGACVAGVEGVGGQWRPLTEFAFEARWTHGGVLAHLEGEGPGRLRVHVPQGCGLGLGEWGPVVLGSWVCGWLEECLGPGSPGSGPVGARAWGFV
jgi:hypothetical protein